MQLIVISKPPSIISMRCPGNMIISHDNMVKKPIHRTDLLNILSERLYIKLEMS
jgi:hypothetical protein